MKKIATFLHEAKTNTKIVEDFYNSAIKSFAENASKEKKIFLKEINSVIKRIEKKYIISHPKVDVGDDHRVVLDVVFSDVEDSQVKGLLKDLTYLVAPQKVRRLGTVFSDDSPVVRILFSPISSYIWNVNALL